MITTLAGGIGLFLLGMILMTDGLKAVAGDSLRRVLSRFVGGPLSAIGAGAATTALVQSSSATTLTTIGFVSAGLLTFPQAVGLILGANLGTTSTGWLVALFGLKMSLASLAFPLVGAGALLRLLGRNRWSSAGLALAGFGTLFVGIATLQTGMESLADRLDPSFVPSGGPLGRFYLVLAGALMTVVMQSSSAAVATTLTGLHAGAIALPQAAALVVGQNLGTTVTAALASLGASIPAKRTALAHILFNTMTGAVALLLLSPFVAASELLSRRVSGDPSELALAGFHTLFNLAGVVILLPWVGSFSRWVERLVPDRKPSLTRHLDETVVHLQPVAIEAARRSLVRVARVLTRALHTILTPAVSPARESALIEAEEALLDLRRFLSQVRSDPETDEEHRRHLSTLHALDHLGRLLQTARQSLDRGALDGELGEAAKIGIEMLAALEGWSDAPEGEGGLDALREKAAALGGLRETLRPAILEKTASGRISPELALSQLEALRWLERVGYHLWRAAHHLSGTSFENAPPAKVLGLEE